MIKSKIMIEILGWLRWHWFLKIPTIKVNKSNNAKNTLSGLENTLNRLNKKKEWAKQKIFIQAEYRHRQLSFHFNRNWLSNKIRWLRNCASPLNMATETHLMSQLKLHSQLTSYKSCWLQPRKEKLPCQL